MIEITPATTAMAALVRGVRDDKLGDPTPCPEYTVGDLVDHIAGLTVAFTRAARKAPSDGQGSGDASRLPEGWRDSITAHLDVLADAWKDPRAWTGMTGAGGVELPGELCGLVALNELAVHAWDLARATGQEYVAEEATLRAAKEFMDAWPDGSRGSAFGPVVDVPEEPSLLDHVVGLSGRDPRWLVVPGSQQAS